MAIGTALFYGGGFAGAILFLAGAGWLAAAPFVGVGLGGGYYFAHVRLAQIEKAIKDCGLPLAEYWRDD